MNHADAQQLLGDHLEGALAPPERARVDAHLAECTDCAHEIAELREVVGLLRSLPDPEPPPWLTTRVMARIADGEAQPSWLLRAARFLGSPSFAAPVAAGFGAVLLLATAFELRPGDLPGDRMGPSQDASLQVADTGSVVGGGTLRTRRPSVMDLPPTTRSVFPPPRVASSFAPFAPVSRSARSDNPQGAMAAFIGSAAVDPPRQRLDEDLDSLLLDPSAFLDGVRGVGAGALERTLEPLVAHSADRGDALDVAHLLRGVAHPEAARVAGYFELAALER